MSNTKKVIFSDLIRRLLDKNQTKHLNHIKVKLTQTLRERLITHMVKVLHEYYEIDDNIELWQHNAKSAKILPPYYFSDCDS